MALERCHGVRARISRDGVVEQLDLASLPELAEAEAIAVCLLFAFRDASHEREVAAKLRRHHRGPAARAARDALVGRAGHARGGSGARGPALLSGPAAGVVGAAFAARVAGLENALAFDMGGTSTDVCAILGGEASRFTERLVGGLPIRLPTVDLHPVGAGGGSLVWRDRAARCASRRRAPGLVAGGERRDHVRSYVVPLEEAGELPREVEADVRYAGQSTRSSSSPCAPRTRRRARSCPCGGQAWS